MKSLLMPFVFCFLCTAVSFNSHALETVFGGKFSISSPVYILEAEEEVPEDPPLEEEEEEEEEKPSLFAFDLETAFSPVLQVYHGKTEFLFDSEFSLSREKYIPQISIDELYLKLLPFHWMQLKLGRYTYLPGSAELFSNTAWFHGIDFERMITGNFQESFIDNYLLQAEFFLWDFYLTLTCSPFPSETALPSTDGFWFPEKGLPQSITLTFPQEKVLVLENIEIKEPEEVDFNLRNFSFSAEAGGALPFLDFSLLYYRGFDNSPPIQARMYFPQGLFENYDIHIQPLRAREDCLGLNLATELFMFRFWADSAYTFNKLFSTKKINSRNFSTETAEYPAIEYSIGTSGEFFPPGLTVMVEFKDTYIFGPDVDLIIPPFYSVLSVLAEQQLFDNRLSLVAAFMLSRLDLSSVQVYSVALRPSSELEFRVLAPVLLGQPDTDFGQYRDNHLVSLSLTWRF